MTTTDPVPMSHDDALPANMPLPVPEALREESLLVRQLAGFQPRSDQHELKRLQTACLGFVSTWREKWIRRASDPNETLEHCLYNVLFEYGQYQVPEPLRLYVLLSVLPDAACDKIDSVAREYDAKRADYDALLGELVPRTLVERADWLVHCDHYDSSIATDFVRSDDAGVYLQILKRQKATSSQPTGISTGIHELDRATHGMRGLWLIGGEGGVGKTALAHYCGWQALINAPDTALILHTLDMSKEACYERVICMLGGITEAELRSRDLTAERQTVVEQAIAEFRRFSDRIDIVYHSPGSALEVEALLSRRIAFLRARNCKRAVMVIDYLQLIPVADDIRDSLEADRRRIEVVQRIQLSVGISEPNVLVVISEVRKPESNSMLVLSDLLGASRLGYSADVVLMMQPVTTDVPCEADSVPVDLGAVKVRRGRKTRIRLMFDFLTYRFRAAAAQHQAASQPAPAASKRRKSIVARNPLD